MARSSKAEEADLIIERLLEDPHDTVLFMRHNSTQHSVPFSREDVSDMYPSQIDKLFQAVKSNFTVEVVLPFRCRNGKRIEIGYQPKPKGSGSGTDHSE